MKNTLFKLNKTTLARNVIISLMLSASLIISVINHAAVYVINTANFFSLILTLIYVFAWAMFEVRAELNGKRGFIIWCRTWFVLGMFCCVFNAIATLVSLTLSGVFAYAASFFVTVFAAPMYGFHVFGDSTVGVMAVGFVLYFALCFIPEATKGIMKRRNIKKILK